jgi:hypothetical protein
VEVAVEVAVEIAEFADVAKEVDVKEAELTVGVGGLATIITVCSVLFAAFAAAVFATLVSEVMHMLALNKEAMDKIALD